MPKVTFVDSGVLIAAATGQPEVASRALEVLDDPDRTFASSDFVRLEVLPKAIYHRKQHEVDFYEAFFEDVGLWASLTDLLVRRAFDEAKAFGLSATDALHVAGALSVGAEELVTTEGSGKPLSRVASVSVRSIRPGDGKAPGDLRANP